MDRGRWIPSKDNSNKKLLCKHPSYTLSSDDTTYMANQKIFL
ncbi:11404_t:CDS:2 [Acaulospora colombiana]|uniref:11404_t:CDS:1 n=1 Tax=Acaulospora colombiana TaxID=27376 RepID=A0ACA9KTQ7_9GLOM|nr:11404_t:CDS:2 [Acaulospora colombiana]